MWLDVVIPHPPSNLVPTAFPGSTMQRTRSDSLIAMNNSLGSLLTSIAGDGDGGDDTDALAGGSAGRERGEGSLHV